MTTKTLPLEDLIELGRNAVLDALDKLMIEQTGHEWAKGWRDSDLAALFPAIDAHIERVAKRFEDKRSSEPGSSSIKITGLQ